MTTARSWARRLGLGLGLALAALAGPTLAAQQEPAKPKWSPAVVVTFGYGDHTGGNAGSQAVTVYLARPDRYWTFSAGHQRLLGEEGYGAGVSFLKAWNHRYRLSAGVSSGFNHTGSLYPRYHAGLSAGMNVTGPLEASLNYAHRQAATDGVHSDQVGIGFTWYAPARLILGGSANYGVNQPGSRSSWSAGGGVTYSVWERWSVGARVDYGDGSYTLLPSQGIEQFESWAYSVSVSKYLAPKVSVRVTGGHTDYYGGFNLSLALAKGW